MNNAPIAFFDSGIGGIPYLDFTRNLLPRESFVYFADRANFPYGEKAPELVRELVADAMRRLIRKADPKLIVMACNTASVLALSHVRSLFHLPFVGVVPAVKPAAQKSRTKRIGVLATSRTVEGTYLSALIEQHAAGCEVVRVAGSNIVDFIENRFFQACDGEIAETIREAVETFREAGVDTVVLGCTHFLFIADHIARALGPDIEVVDSVEGVARQVIRILDCKAIRAAEGRNSRLLLSGGFPAEDRYREISVRYRIPFDGVI